MADEAREQLPFRPKTDFDETYPFGDKFVNIKASAADFRRDTIENAVKQGITRDRADYFYHDTEFYFDNPPLKPNEEEIGYVDWLANPDRLICFVNVPLAINEVLRITEKSSKEASPKVRDEIQMIALGNILKGVVSHEQTHLIRAAKFGENIRDNLAYPTQEQLEKDLRKFGKLSYVPLGVAGGLLLSTSLNFVSLSSLDTSMAIAGVSIVSFGIKAVAEDRTRAQHRNRYDRHESEVVARKSAGESDGLPNRFEISLEK